MGREGRPAPAAVNTEPPAPDFPDDAVEVGRVIGAWGVKGAIKVQPFAADPQALFSSKRWWLRPPQAVAAGPVPAARSAPPPLLRVRQAKEHGDVIIATCDGVDDRDAAEALKGARVFVARSSFPTAAADEYYWVDLIGASVVNREGRVLGTVSGLLETGPQCVLCVTPPAADAGAAAGTEARTPDDVLIPFVAAYVDSVDTAARLIRVDWQADY